MIRSNEIKARGNFWKRALGVCFLLPAWFAPHSKLRIFFHRLRGVSIGNHCEIGYFVIMGNVHPELITIEDGATVTARCTLLEHDNAYFYTGRGEVKSRPILIKKGAFLGIACIVAPGITIGERAIVGALSLVTHDVPAESIVVGQPARELKLKR